MLYVYIYYVLRVNDINSVPTCLKSIKFALTQLLVQEPPVRFHLNLEFSGRELVRVFYRYFRSANALIFLLKGTMQQCGHA